MWEGVARTFIATDNDDAGDKFWLERGDAFPRAKRFLIKTDPDWWEEEGKVPDISDWYREDEAGLWKQIERMR